MFNEVDYLLNFREDIKVKVWFYMLRYMMKICFGNIFENKVISF